MEITAKDFPELAGWQAMKKARALVAAGSVAKAERGGGDADQPLLFRGVVVEGRRKYACGLRIRSLSDADNLCSCPAARRDGQICEHSVAVALSALEKAAASTGASRQVPDAESVKNNSLQNAWLPVLRVPVVEWDGRRPIAARLVVPAADAEVVPGFEDKVRACLRALGVDLGGAPQLLSLAPGHFLQLLDAAVGGALPIDAGKAAPGEVFKLFVAETLTRLPLDLRAHPECPGRALLRRPALADTLFLGGAPDLWILRVAEQLAIRVPGVSGERTLRTALAPLFEHPSEVAEVEVDSAWLREQIDHLHCMFHMECSDGLIDSLREVPGMPSVALAVEGSLKRVDLKLTFSYQAGEAVNLAFENAAIERLAATGTRSKSAPTAGAAGEVRRSSQIFIRGEDAILDFYAGVLDRLITEGDWQIEIGERFAALTREIEKVRPQVALSAVEGNDWLGFDLSFVAAGGETVPETEVRRLLATGQSRLKLVGGRRAAIDRTRISALYDGLAEADGETLAAATWNRRIPESQQFYIQEITKEFTNLEAANIAPELVGFHAELRPYQRAGVAWLHRRRLAGHGAILADEMGLGKTVQSLALIAALGGAGGGAGPSLIVCPTSMLRTWQREAARFVPGHSVLLLHGAGRQKRFGEIASTDIVLTSYGSLVRDIDAYPALQFRLAIADEASFIKNPRSQTAKAVGRIDAASRVALTGTPIENAIGDLWSIMEFANPGYLGRRDDFVARHAGTDIDSARRLRQRLTPYLLRRRKAEVATDLPAKLERVLYCDLTAKQRAVYERLLREGREKMRDLSGTQGAGAARMEVLTVLLRLRQACCDLRLLGGEGARAADSAKLAAFDTLIAEALAGGHRVLVFSQFVSMLTLLREHLDAQGHRYAYLDGSTPAAGRAAQVEAFQAGDELPIFLISLKAGGYGLTLTGADTVVHFDPWWNPAVEAQATDRAHRIGQTNPVTAYKLIATGTVEEKILRLQERKRDLVASALDEQRPLMAGLSREDIDFVLG